MQATATDAERAPIAYAMPIGGGWAHFCVECFEAHRDDPESDPDVVAECEEVIEFCTDAPHHCEICGDEIPRHA